MISPSSSEFIPGFGFARVRDKAFAAIRELWRQREAEGWTQVHLAERMARDPAWVSRKLSGPTNWTLRTFGELADAMDGEVGIEVCDLNTDQAAGNHDAYSGYGFDPSLNGDILNLDERKRALSYSDSSAKATILDFL